MSYIQGLNTMRSYGENNLIEEEALADIFTNSVEEQVRIEENTNDRLVLLNLTMNKNITKKAVEVLYDRDMPDLTRRLDNRGFKKPELF